MLLATGYKAQLLQFSSGTQLSPLWGFVLPHMLPLEVVFAPYAALVFLRSEKLIGCSLAPGLSKTPNDISSEGKSDF